MNNPLICLPKISLFIYKNVMPYVIYGFTLVYLFFKGDTINILHTSPVTSSVTEESIDRPSAPMTSKLIQIPSNCYAKKTQNPS